MDVLHTMGNHVGGYGILYNIIHSVSNYFHKFLNFPFYSFFFRSNTYNL